MTVRVFCHFERSEPRGQFLLRGSRMFRYRLFEGPNVPVVNSRVFVFEAISKRQESKETKI